MEKEEEKVNFIIFLLSSICKNCSRGFESARAGIARDLQAWKNERILESRRVF